MSKNIKRLISFIIATTMCVGVISLSACFGGEQGPQGERGPQGEQGIQGENGENGVTPHVGENGNWWIGTTDTGVPARGESAGISPHIGENGNWWIGTVDTGVKAAGQNGQDGQDGKTPYIGENGNWWIGNEDTGVKAKGEASDAATWLLGVDTPSSTEGKDGDFFINTLTYNLYHKEKGVWVFICNIGNDSGIGTWDGKIPGWQAPYLTEEEIIANRPVSYVVNESAKTIELHNVDAFAWFAYRSVVATEGYDGWTISLKCDIDLNNQMWVPIGLGARSNAPGVAFKGTFDGEGHTIYNLNSAKFYDAIHYGDYEVYISATETETHNGYYIPYKNGDVTANIPLLIDNSESREEKIHDFSYGLFSTVENATIKNLNIENVNISLGRKHVEGAPAEEYIEGGSVGAIVGYAHGSLTLTNCRVGSENGNDIIGHSNCVGGLVGRAYGGSDASGMQGPYLPLNISNCTNHADLGTTGYGEKGGIIGHPAYFDLLNVIDCTNKGDIWGFYAGGIVAYRGEGTSPTGGAVTFKNCENYGNIKSNAYAGGIIAYRSGTAITNTNFFMFKDCSNFGNITADAATVNTMREDSDLVYLGGIAGYIQLNNAAGVVTNCMNYGNIDVAVTDTNQLSGKTFYVGGVFGYMGVDMSKASLTLMCGSCGDISVTWENATQDVLANNLGFVSKAIGQQMQSGSAPAGNEPINIVYLIESGSLSLPTV